MELVKKIEDIFSIIKEIEPINSTVSDALLEGYALALNLINYKASHPDSNEIDKTEQLEIISQFLGFSLEDLVKHIISTSAATEMSIVSAKEPDVETLKFITADLDDYERFLAENKATEAINFLNSEL